MREFFRGWRRKVGCVTLVLACMTMGMWMRSQIVIDFLLFPFGERQQEIIVASGRIYWQATVTINDGEWAHATREESALWLDGVLEHKNRYAGDCWRFNEWVIELWLCALLLTLLSAYLILWKPRKAK